MYYNSKQTLCQDFCKEKGAGQSRRLFPPNSNKQSTKEELITAGCISPTVERTPHHLITNASSFLSKIISRSDYAVKTFFFKTKEKSRRACWQLSSLNLSKFCRSGQIILTVWFRSLTTNITHHSYIVNPFSKLFSKNLKTPRNGPSSLIKAFYISDDCLPCLSINSSI